MRGVGRHENHLRAELARALQLIERLQGDFETIVEASNAVSTDDEHDPEGATIGYERAQIDAMLTMTRAHVAELELAIERARNGTHLSCQTCGGPIGDERLEAQPATTQCVGCASRAIVPTPPPVTFRLGSARSR